MKYEETVMKTSLEAVWDFEKFKLDQAKVSFKAGQESMSVEETGGYFRGRADGIKIGRFEVVEWIKQQPKIGTGVFIVGIEHEQIYGWKVLFNELQAKLKDWGINEIRG